MRKECGAYHPGLCPASGAKGCFKNKRESPAMPVGLKDHEIQELANLLTARLSPVSKVQCLREMIHGELVPYLEGKGLRIDR